MFSCLTGTCPAAGKRASMANLGIILFMAAIVLLPASGAGAACSSESCQVHDICTKDSDCVAGLQCISCSSVGDMNYRCTRTKTTDPSLQVGGLPFNKYSWLTTHNSYAIIGEKSYTGVQRITFNNQEVSVTDQLNNGTRGLMLDMYDFENDVWLCHSFGGNCYNFTAFMPAVNTLKEIQAFLAANPSEIVTIFIEDYVKATKGLTKVFTAAGLMKYWYPVSAMPKNGSDWPTVSDMVAKNYRLIVFTSIASKEASEGIAYQWNYVVENQYGDAGLVAGNCTNRAESKNLSSKAQSLVLENFFPDQPSVPKACVDNSDQLSNILSVCHQAAGNRWANFLAVDFFQVQFITSLHRAAVFNLGGFLGSNGSKEQCQRLRGSSQATAFTLTLTRKFASNCIHTCNSTGICTPGRDYRGSLV